jgi:hypothetical protein
VAVDVRYADDTGSPEHAELTRQAGPRRHAERGAKMRIAYLASDDQVQATGGEGGSVQTPAGPPHWDAQ